MEDKIVKGVYKNSDLFDQEAHSYKKLIPLLASSLLTKLVQTLKSFSNINIP